MTINWAQIKSDVADGISTAMANVMQADFSKWPIPGEQIAATYTWDGSNTITTSDTSEVKVTPPTFLKYGLTGAWYRVASIDPGVSVTVEDFYSVGSYPSGSAGTYKALSGCPNPPSTQLFKDKLGTPISDAVVDGIKAALDQAEINDVADDAGNTVGPGVIV